MNKSTIHTLAYIQPFATIVFLKTYYQWSHFLSSFQWWSKEEIDQFQLNRIQSLLSHVASSVPYYSQLFQDHHVNPRDIRSIEDIHHIPLLTKDIIRKHSEQLRSTTFPVQAFHRSYTGGTTGDPLLFYVEKARWLGKHFAFNRVYMQQAGYDGTQRVVSFSGKTKKIHHHPLLRTIEFSTFHMNPDDLFSYWKRMQSYHPRFLSAYPSALSIFTNYLLKSKKQVPGLQAIFCHGETLTDNQRTLFENVYDCRVYDQYGHREQCVFATTCPESNLYHINPAYGYVEVIDKRGFPLTTSQEQGEIVATSLHNHLFPFIRYNTEDLAIISHKRCDCGRNFPLLERIIGRKQDFLITKENHPIPLTGLYHVIAESSIHIKECQLFQDTPGEVIVSIVTEKGFTDHDEHRIKKQFSNRFSDHFNLIIKPVESIPRTHGGKFRYLIQKLSYPIFDD